MRELSLPAVLTFPMLRFVEFTLNSANNVELKQASNQLFIFVHTGPRCFVFSVTHDTKTVKRGGRRPRYQHDTIIQCGLITLLPAHQGFSDN